MNTFKSVNYCIQNNISNIHNTLMRYMHITLRDFFKFKHGNNLKQLFKGIGGCDFLYFSYIRGT